MSDAVTVGRIVHYVLAGGAHRPAIVTKVVGDSGGGEGGGAPGDPHVNLTVFMDAGDHFGNIAIWYVNVPHDERKDEGSWHWPERA